MRMYSIYLGVAALPLLWAQQTTLIDPTQEGSFEGTGMAGWTMVDQTGQPNHWCIGNVNTPAPSHGSRYAYISDTTDCSRHSYTNGPGDVVVHLYRSITVPTGQTFLTLSLKALQRGEGDADALEVYLLPIGTALSGGILPPATNRLFRVMYTTSSVDLQSGYAVSNVSWTSLTYYTCAEAGTYWLVFSWKNDRLVRDNPPIAMDEISLIASATAPDPALGSGVTPVTTFPYSHTPTPATTCGQSDDIRVFQVKNPCSASHLDSEDRVWTFTAPQNGCLQVTFLGDTTESSDAWLYFGLQLFEGNPFACGRCIASHTTFSQARRTLRANVTSGQKYYLLLDGDASPNCGRFLELRIDLSAGVCATALSPASDGFSDLTLGPSPAQDYLHLRGEVASPEPLRLIVWDAQGRKLWETSLSPAAGSFAYSLPVSDWPSGLYFLQLTQGYNSLSRSFLKE